MLKNILSTILLFAFVFQNVHSDCIIESQPLDILQCITINPQTLVSLMITKDLSNLCSTVNAYMQCMRSYFKDCVGGNIAIGALDELTDLNYKCCVTKNSSKCITNNPELLKNCFSVDNFVTLENNVKKPIIDIKVGDVVKTIASNGEIINSEVVSILHKEIDEFAVFYNLQTSSGNSISLTGGHLINIKEKGFIKASEVEINDVLRVLSGDTIIDSKIVKINNDIKKGYIAPLTDKGTILVNNVDASCYAEINSQTIADLAMTPLKLWYKVSKLFGYGQTQSTMGINTYAMVLERFTTTFLPFLF